MTGFRVPRPGRIHVFCEGETEVLYLQDFCRLIGLSGKKAVISVCPVKNPARAIEWICRQVPGVSKASAASPECWLVIDRDRHEGFHEAFELVKQHPCIHLAATKPCFEYWLLLHFDDFQDDLPLAQGWYVAKRQVQGKQVAPDRSVRMTMEFLERVAHPEAVLKRLKKHMPGYGKNKAGVFAQLFPFLGTALWRTLGGMVRDCLNSSSGSALLRAPRSSMLRAARRLNLLRGAWRRPAVVLRAPAFGRRPGRLHRRIPARQASRGCRSVAPEGVP